MAAFKNILVATDFGEVSHNAEDVACDLAATFGAQLTLMHVWSIPTPSYAEAIVLPLEDIEKAASETMARELERVREKNRGVRSLLQPGVAWRAVVEVAEAQGFDLIVIGTHGRRGVPRLFLGSVAERIVRASPVPVLTVRS
jgi:nucleotide-binding universal stress UspA family protein